MSAKQAILDASSAIILYKSGLHQLLIDIYDIIMAASVYREITANPYAGSREYRQLVAVHKIQVQEIATSPAPKGTAGLDTGEYDTIQLFYAGLGNFIITDDGSAARYCKKEGIPFINSLLFPVILRYAQTIDEKFCHELMRKIIEQGRYSKEIITFAQNCRQESIAFAMPLLPVSL